jgi:alkylation response protein AidB-like acyl-CoA dehydrogenase
VAPNADGDHGLRQHDELAETYDIFDGTEQIQQLVISRAISGLRIE